ncbi:MAG: hypothetical protein ACP5M3_07490 [Acidithiobacillus sp.]
MSQISRFFPYSDKEAAEGSLLVSDSIRLAGWIASAITIACALTLAVDRTAPMRWLFLAWSVSNTLWVLYGWGIRSGSVLASQLVFCAIDLIGLVHYWG